MFRKVFSFGGMLLLIGAAILLTPGLSLAQRHGGGGHMGGGHGGGGHFGGGHFGGFHGGHVGGFHHGFGHGFDHGFHHGFGHVGRFHHGFDHGFHGFHHRFGHAFGFYPYYGVYPDYGYYGTYPDYGVSPSYGTYDSPAYGSYDSSSYYPYSGTADLPSASAETDNSAHLTIKVPADARIWVDGTATTSTGSVREFSSPPLKPGSQYYYEVQARWNENGHEVTQTQHVTVSAGASVRVDFPVAPNTQEKTPATQKR